MLTYYIWTVIFILGMVIGSFLNVVIYRLHTKKSVTGRSHCLSCGEVLKWYELVPVISYLMLRGRCRTCSAHIPFRYVAVELLTGALFLLTYVTFSSLVEVVVFWIIVSLLMVILVYDIRHTIIPDEIVILLLSCSFALMFWDGVAGNIVKPSAESLLAGFFASAIFYLLWFFSNGRWIGLGDAKLAFPLGMIVGLPSTFSFVVLAFWVGALVSVVILSAQKLHKRGKKRLGFTPNSLTMKSEVPFAPFLIASFILVVYFGANVFTILYALIPPV